MSQGAIAKCWLNGERKSPATLKLTGTTNSWIDPRLNRGFRGGMLWGDGIIIRNILNICMYVCIYIYVIIYVCVCACVIVYIHICHCIYMSLKVN